MKYIATGLISLSTLDFHAVDAAAKKVFPVAAPVEKTGTLTIKVTGFRNEKGGVGFALYNSKAGFDKDQTFREDMARISNRIATITLRNLPVGVYGAAAFHDENNNQKLDENMLGIPTEGVGLSNNPKMSVTNIPTFDKIKFNVTEGEQTIEFKIQY
jgi:uncharacterized protein (DUF2141 family)